MSHRALTSGGFGNEDVLLRARVANAHGIGRRTTDFRNGVACQERQSTEGYRFENHTGSMVSPDVPGQLGGPETANTLSQGIVTD